MIGSKILVAESDAYAARVVVDLLEEAGAVVVGPFLRESEAIHSVLTENLDLVIFNAYMCDRRVDLLAECIDRAGLRSFMVNAMWLMASDPLRQQRVQLLQPLDSLSFLNVTRALLAVGRDL